MNEHSQELLDAMLEMIGDDPSPESEKLRKLARESMRGVTLTHSHVLTIEIPDEQAARKGGAHG